MIAVFTNYLKLLRPTPTSRNFFDGHECPINRINTMAQSRDYGRKQQLGLETSAVSIFTVPAEQKSVNSWKMIC